MRPADRLSTAVSRIVRPSVSVEPSRQYAVQFSASDTGMLRDRADVLLPPGWAGPTTDKHTQSSLIGGVKLIGEVTLGVRKCAG